MKTKKEILKECKEINNQFMFGVLDRGETKHIILTIDEYLKYESLISDKIRKYTSVISIREDVYNNRMEIWLNSKDGFNVYGSFIHAFHNCNKSFGMFKFILSKNLRERKEFLEKAKSFRKENHADNIKELKEKQALYNKAKVM